MGEHVTAPGHFEPSSGAIPAVSAGEFDSSNARPRAVLLDFHNTTAVVRSFDSWVSDAEALLPRGRSSEPIPTTKIRSVWSDAQQLFPTLDWDLDPVAHRHAFVSTLRRDDAVAVDLAEALYETMPNQWVLNVGVSEFIARATGTGMRVAIVSNIALDIRPALESWGIASALDAVVLSFEVGYVKPDPRIFRHAADLLGTDPRDCVMIGDSAHDDVGGASLGMQCLITRPEQMRRAFELVCPR